MRLVACSVGLVVSCAATVAAAQVGPSPTAPLTAGQRRALLQRAVRASDRGDHRGALALAEDVARAGETPSLELFMAEEWEALAADRGAPPDEAARRFAEAAGLATRCLRDAGARPRLRQRARILTDCAALLRRVSPRVAGVRVSVTPSVEGVAVFVNGRASTEAERREVIPVAPGVVIVTALAPGRLGFSRELNVPAGAVGDVDVMLPVARDESTGGAPPRVAGGARVPAAVTVARVTPATRAEPRPVAVRHAGAGPWVVIGVGGAAVVTSAVFFALQAAANDRREAHCPRSDGLDRCPDVTTLSLGRAAYEEERTWRNAGVVALVAGGALAGAGVLWYLLAPRRAPAVAVTPWRHGVGITVGGTL